MYRSTTCFSCRADARVCLNCTFYDRLAHWECRETIGEAVLEKERANFCDWFRPSTAARADGGSQEQRRAQEKKDLGKLFGD